MKTSDLTTTGADIKKNRKNGFDRMEAIAYRVRARFEESTGYIKKITDTTVNVARALGNKLQGVRLDTPSERGGVTVDLVKETRSRLDQAGYKDVKILVSGGLNPERISQFINECAPVDFFGVGSHISDSGPIDFTADLHEVEGRPVAKRGRVPGITNNYRLKRIL